MDGSVNSSELATLSLLNGGRGGIGVGGGGYGYGQFADDTSNAVRINSGEKLATQGHAFIAQKINDSADRQRDITGLLNDSVQFGRVNDRITDAEKANAVAHNELIREMNANARIAAECCCEAKVLALTNHAATQAQLATVLANQNADNRVADAVSNAQQNAKLDVILASGRGNSGN